MDRLAGTNLRPHSRHVQQQHHDADAWVCAGRLDKLTVQPPASSSAPEASAARAAAPRRAASKKVIVESSSEEDASAPESSGADSAFEDG